MKRLKTEGGPLLSNKCLQDLSSNHKGVLLIELKSLKVEQFPYPLCYREHHKLSIIRKKSSVCARFLYQGSPDS